ncbi:helix-turn-helix domain-containing protein [Acetobacter sacchari]|uniref:helix-turn-helix domain-containing protein n=1 Tax=Acetobacter sacchari TaxID=2661687 RepID=UPI0034E05C71
MQPTPDQIRDTRVAAGLTQEDAAALIHSQRRTWQNWELGTRVMHPGLWELFCIKVGESTPNPATSAACAP